MDQTKIIKKKKKARKTRAYDPKREAQIKLLCKALEDAGYSVRREKLKQGHGWKVLSGSCRHEDSRLVFVDRQMTQEDQLSFIIMTICQLEIQIPEEILAELNDSIRNQLNSVSNAA